MPFIVKIEQLHPPQKFNFNTSNLELDWENWKKELEIYLDFAMAAKEPKLKQNCFYLMGTREREIYNTLKFEKESKNRTVTDIMKVFDKYCSSKINETVEGYNFFHTQATGKSFD